MHGLLRILHLSWGNDFLRLAYAFVVIRAAFFVLRTDYSMYTSDETLEIFYGPVDQKNGYNRGAEVTMIRFYATHTKARACLRL